MPAIELQLKANTASGGTTTSATLKSEVRQKSSKPPESAKPRDVDLLASIFTQILRKDWQKYGVIVRYAKSRTKPNTLIAEFSGITTCQDCNAIFPFEVLSAELCPDCIANIARATETNDR